MRNISFFILLYQVSSEERLLSTHMLNLFYSQPFNAYSYKMVTHKYIFNPVKTDVDNSKNKVILLIFEQTVQKLRNRLVTT